MSDEYSPSKGPGKYVCRYCGSDQLTFSGNGTWNQETQDMDFEEGDDKPYCQQCEDTTTWARFVPLDHDGRRAPKLSPDYEGTLLIVVDDTGEPVSHYTRSRTRAIEWRDARPEWRHYRIARVGFKVLVPGDGTPIEIADDPRAKAEVAA